MLKGAWGSQSTRLTRDSYLPFGSCQLCLQIARDPVACAANGEIFCRECAVNNLLSQRKEIKRLEKEFEKGLRDLEDENKERDEEERARTVNDFERTLMGLDGKGGVAKAKDGAKTQEAAEARGVKRKHGIDEDEMLKNTVEERAKARKAIDDEKAADPKLPSFWVPSLTPSTKRDLAAAGPPKLNPLCPASSPSNKHNLSLKSLITINFKQSDDRGGGTDTASAICPACMKVLSNTNKAVMTVPCGHVLCKPCAAKLMTPETGPPDPHATHDDRKEVRTTSCYVCSTNITPQKPSQEVAQGKKKSKKSEKGEVTPGLVELKCDGTGFAGGGDNIVQRHGTVFQC